VEESGRGLFKGTVQASNEKEHEITQSREPIRDPELESGIIIYQYFTEMVYCCCQFNK